MNISLIFKLKIILLTLCTSACDLPISEQSRVDTTLNGKPPITLVGLVTNSDGNPITGIEIHLPQYGQIVNTDFSGRYRFSQFVRPLLKKPVELIAIDPTMQYQPQVTDVLISTMTTRHDFVLAYIDSKNETIEISDQKAQTIQVDITSGPFRKGFLKFAKFEFSCSAEDQPCITECQLDEGQWQTCESPYLVENLSPAFHTFQLRNARSNETIAYNWEISDKYKPRILLQHTPRSACQIKSRRLSCWGWAEYFDETTRFSFYTTNPVFASPITNWRTISQYLALTDDGDLHSLRMPQSNFKLEDITLIDKQKNVHILLPQGHYQKLNGDVFSLDGKLLVNTNLIAANNGMTLLNYQGELSIISPDLSSYYATSLPSITYIDSPYRFTALIPNSTSNYWPGDNFPDYQWPKLTTSATRHCGYTSITEVVCLDIIRPTDTTSPTVVTPATTHIIAVSELPAPYHTDFDKPPITAICNPNASGTSYCSNNPIGYLLGSNWPLQNQVKELRQHTFSLPTTTKLDDPFLFIQSDDRPSSTGKLTVEYFGRTYCGIKQSGKTICWGQAVGHYRAYRNQFDYVIRPDLRWTEIAFRYRVEPLPPNEKAIVCFKSTEPDWYCSTPRFRQLRKIRGASGFRYLSAEQSRQTGDQILMVGIDLENRAFFATHDHTYANFGSKVEVPDLFEPLFPNHLWTQIAAGHTYGNSSHIPDHTTGCGLTIDLKLYCWGTGVPYSYFSIWTNDNPSDEQRSLFEVNTNGVTYTTILNGETHDSMELCLLSHSIETRCSVYNDSRSQYPNFLPQTSDVRQRGASNIYRGETKTFAVQHYYSPVITRERLSPENRILFHEPSGWPEPIFEITPDGTIENVIAVREPHNLSQPITSVPSYKFANQGIGTTALTAYYDFLAIDTSGQLRFTGDPLMIPQREYHVRHLPEPVEHWELPNPPTP